MPEPHRHRTGNCDLDTVQFSGERILFQAKHRRQQSQYRRPWRYRVAQGVDVGLGAQEMAVFGFPAEAEHVHEHTSHRPVETK